MVQHNQIPHTRQRQPSPSGPSMSRKGPQNSGRKHNIVSSDRAQEISTRETGDQREVDEQQGRAKGPVDIPEPEDLAEGVGMGVWDVFVDFCNVVFFEGHALTRGQSEVGYEGDGCDQGTGGVEDPLCLWGF